MFLGNLYMKKRLAYLTLAGSLLLNTFSQSMKGRVVSALDGAPISNVNVVLNFDNHTFSTNTDSDGYYFQSITSVKDKTSVRSGVLLYAFPSTGKNKLVQVYVPNNNYKLGVSDILGKTKVLSENLSEGFNEFAWSNQSSDSRYIFFLKYNDKIIASFPVIAKQDNVLPSRNQFGVLEQMLQDTQDKSKNDLESSVSSDTFPATITFSKSGFHTYVDSDLNHDGDGSPDIELDAYLIPKVNLVFPFQPYGVDPVSTLLDMFNWYCSSTSILNKKFFPPKYPVKVFVNESQAPHGYAEDVRYVMDKINDVCGLSVFEEVAEIYVGEEFTSAKFNYTTDKSIFISNHVFVDRNPWDPVQPDDVTFNVLNGRDFADTTFFYFAHAFQTLMYNGNANADRPQHVGYGRYHPGSNSLDYSLDEKKLMNVAIRVPSGTKFRNFKK